MSDSGAPDKAEQAVKAEKRKGEPFVRFVRVEKAFGPKVIYANLSPDILRGETITIMGASGSGKSVMLKMLIGLLRPDAGQILLDGRDVAEMNDEGLTEVRRRVAYLFQGPPCSTP